MKKETITLAARNSLSLHFVEGETTVRMREEGESGRRMWELTRVWILTNVKVKKNLLEWIYVDFMLHLYVASSLLRSERILEVFRPIEIIQTSSWSQFTTSSNQQVSEDSTSRILSCS